MQEKPLGEYHYTLPPELVAHEPAPVRDEARLFVYDTKTDTIVLDTFKHIASFLPHDSILLLNDTTVMPARLSGVVIRENTEETTELLILVNEPCSRAGALYALTQSRIAIGRTICFGSDTCTVVGKENGRLILVCSIDFSDLLRKHGQTPTPPYLERRLSEEMLRERYQTIYARTGASVAAPTASLHLTERVFDAMRTKRIDTYCATLQVGMGTFAPVWDEHIKTGTLHAEWYSIPEHTVRAVRKAKQFKKPIIAVGTTVVRMFESASQMLLNDATHSGASIVGSTNLFIRTGYEFRLTDHLITNFHVPESSLMSLVSAFLHHKNAKKSILELYAKAIEERFRFYSFGDSMLIL